MRYEDRFLIIKGEEYGFDKEVETLQRAYHDLATLHGTGNMPEDYVEYKGAHEDLFGKVADYGYATLLPLGKRLGLQKEVKKLENAYSFLKTDLRRKKATDALVISNVDPEMDFIDAFKNIKKKIKEFERRSRGS